MDYFQQYYLNTAISHQNSARLLASGAQRFTTLGLHTTAVLWQNMAALHYKCARVEMHRYYLQRTAKEWDAATRETGLMA